jgi:hypothetical protein
VFVLRVAAYVSRWPVLVATNLAERLFDLSGDFERERVQALREVTDIAQKIIVKDDGGNGGKKSRGGGDQGFGDAWRDGTQACGASGSEAGEGVDDTPHRAEEADEGSDGAGGGEPSHAFFDAANFFCGCKLHVDCDSAEALQPGRLWISRMSAHLKLEFAITSGVDVGEGRTGSGERLRIGNAARCAVDTEELIALTTEAAKQAEFLKNHPPGDDREEKKQSQDAAGNPTGLFKNAAEVDGEGCNQKKRNNDSSV